MSRIYLGRDFEREARALALSHVERWEAGGPEDHGLLLVELDLLRASERRYRIAAAFAADPEPIMAFNAICVAVEFLEAAIPEGALRPIEAVGRHARQAGITRELLDQARLQLKIKRERDGKGNLCYRRPQEVES